MKITLVIDKFTGRSGGAERVLIQTAHALQEQGHKVEIISFEPRRGKAFYPIDPSIKQSNIYKPNSQAGLVLRLKRLIGKILGRLKFYASPFDKITWYFQNQEFKTALEEYLNHSKPDRVIAFLPPALVALGFSQLNFETIKLASLHNVPAEDFDSPKRWDPNPYDRNLRKKALQEYNKIGILLPEFFEWFPSNLQDRLVEMPNSIPTVDPSTPIEVEKEKLIIAVGRLANVKRHELLISSWATIAEKFPDWKVEIYGVGPNKTALRNQIEKLGIGGSIRLAMHSTDIITHYQRAKFLVHSAEFEGFGLVIAEALSHGLPVVGFEDCPGLNTLVQDSKNGLLVSGEGDLVENLARSIEKLILNEKLQKSLSVNAPSSVEKYSPKRIAEIWANFVR